MNTCARKHLHASAMYLRETSLHDAEQGAASHIGHDHPQLLFVHKGAVQRHDIRVAHLMHNLCLPHDDILQEQYILQRRQTQMLQGVSTCPLQASVLPFLKRHNSPVVL
jgi:hypothetical protein